MPLRGFAAVVNHSAAALLRDIQQKRTWKRTPAADQFLASLSSAVLETKPPLELSVHEGKPFGPVCVSLYLTEACNLRCVYCYAQGGANRNPKTISLEAAQAGIDFVAQNAANRGEPAFVVNFHGAGEPTVAWTRIQQLVAYANATAQRLGLGVSFSTCTNGVMSEDCAEWLSRHTHAATVSLDGLPIHQDRLRPKADGTGSFDDVARTLRCFRKNDFYYSIRATITRENVSSMAEMARFLASEFRPAELHFDPAFFAGRCCSTGCRLSDDETYAIEFMRASDAAAAIGCPLSFSVLSFNALKTYYCCSVSDGFTVTHDGCVTACFDAYHPSHPQADLFVYGRYDIVGHRFVFDEAKLARLRRRHIHNLPECANCFCKYGCAGDCPLDGLRRGVPLERAEGRCALTQSIARYRLAKLAFPSGSQMPRAFSSDVCRDHSVGAYAGPPCNDPPLLLHVVNFAVRECSYMKPPQDGELAQRFVASGNTAYRELDFDKALRHYDQALELDRNQPEVHNNRGLCLHKMGKVTEAVASLRHALALAPGRAEYHLNLGKVLAASLNWRESLDEFERALACSPGLTAALCNKAWVLLEIGDIPEAISLLQDLVHRVPDNPQVQLLADLVRQAGGIFSTGNRTTAAVADQHPQRWLVHLNQCLAQGGADDLAPEIRHLMESAMRAFSRERHDEVRTHLDLLEACAPDHPVPYYLSAMCRLAQGQEKEANRAMSKASRSMPRIRFLNAAPGIRVSLNDEPIASPAEHALLPGWHEVFLGEHSSAARPRRIFLKPREILTIDALKEQTNTTPDQRELDSAKG